MPEELQFLKQEQLPLPRTAIDVRNNKRLDFRLKNQTYTRQCDCDCSVSINGLYTNFTSHAFHEGRCKNVFMSGYNPEDNDIVYCEQCYQQEII